MRIACCVVGVLLAHACAWGQAASTAQISGTVRDTTGLAVPGAEAKVTQTATGLTRTVTTGADGSYVLTDLPVGPYQLEVSKDGFFKYVQAGIVLQVDSNPSIAVTLKVGSVTEQIQVVADAALVDTQNAGIGQVVDNQRVVELPLNGRQANELVYLSGIATPGGNTTATEPGGSGFNSGQRNYPTQIIAVAGGTVTGVAYSLDGDNHSDPYANVSLPFPFPDALQEFKVETSALGAQYGRYAAAAVNAVTKSGTNSFHGDVFDFVRNTDVNARNAFATAGDGLKRNQPGGVIGGPIRPDKLFFFLGYQSTIERIEPTTFLSFVPTADMRAGNFTTIASPQCNANRQINLPAPFVNNMISPALFSAPATNILNLPGFPTSSNPCGQISFGRPEQSNEYQGVGRIDYQQSAKHSLFGRYFGSHLFEPTDADPTKNLLQGNMAALDFLIQTAVIGDTYLIGNGTVSSFRAAINRTSTPKGTMPSFDASDVGINTWVGVPHILKIAMTGGFNIGSSASTPTTFASLAYQFSEDLSAVRGAHQFRFGGTYIHDILNIYSSLNSYGTFTFSGQVTGLGMADFMIGKAASFTQGAPNLVYERQNYIGIYGQDTWKATSRLTINYGVRWDPWQPIYSKTGWVYNFSPTLFAEGVRSTQYSNAPAGLTYPGDPGYPGTSPSFGDWKNLAPRVALAWDPQGNGRTAIRAAYGVFFDLPSFNQANVFSASSPFGGTATVNFPSSFANPWAGVPGGNPFPLPVGTQNINFVQFGTYENWLLHPKTPNVQQWNLSIQRQLGANWLLQANYVGAATRHLWGGNEANPGVYIPGSCVINGVTTNPCSTAANVNFRRLLYLQNPSQGQDYGIIYQLDDGGTGSYNALVLSAQKRFAHGYTVQTVYTWSRCISDMADVELGGAGTLYEIPFDRSAERSNCPGTDRRQNFVLSGVYETPKFAGARLRAVASGWQISTILRAVTGPYVSVLSGLDQALTGQTSYERPNQVLANPYGPGPSQYLNPKAFAQPALGTYGDLAPYNILAPGAIYLDMAVTRTVKIKERYSLQFRVEAFNVPNLVNLGTPTGVSGPLGVTTPTVALNNPQFGRILAADDPRIFQGAFKFMF